jgi:site-specific DNA-cytosine methylase
MLRASFAILILVSALHGVAQNRERGYWQAASNTAASITGDLSISEAKISINFKAFPLASIRSLKPSEVSAVFDADSNAASPGTLYRLKIPAEQRFLHKNALCGAQDTQWMAAYAVGKSLQVAFFSGEDAPEFTFDAIAHSTNLCGTFSYAR